MLLQDLDNGNPTEEEWHARKVFYNLPHFFFNNSCLCNQQQHVNFK